MSTSLVAPPRRTALLWTVWTVWAVGVGAYIVSIVNRTSLSAVGVDAADRFSADAATLSLFAVLQLAVYGGVQIPVGLLLDRWGARIVMTVGLLVMSGGQIVMAVTPDVGVAIAARVLIGAGEAAIFPGMLRVISAWFSPRQAPLAVQITGLLGQFGQIISVVPLVALLGATSWTVAFAFLGAAGILFAVIVLAIVRDEPPDARLGVGLRAPPASASVMPSASASVVPSASASVVPSASASVVPSASGDLGRGLAESLRSPATRLAFWVHFTTSLAIHCFAILWGYPFLVQGQGLTAGEAGLMFTLFVLFGIVAGPLIGALSGWRPRARLPAAVAVVVAQAAVWSVVMIIPGAAPTGILIALVFVLCLGGPASMLAFDIARDATPPHRLGTATGIINGGGFLSGVLAILLVGVALQLQGASSPDEYSRQAFSVAFAVQFPLWTIGLIAIGREWMRLRLAALDRG